MKKHIYFTIAGFTTLTAALFLSDTIFENGTPWDAPWSEEHDQQQPPLWAEDFSDLIIEPLDTSIEEADENAENNRPIDTAQLVNNYLAARLNEHNGNIPNAAAFYDSAQAADPENPWLKEKAFVLQLEVGNTEEALTLAEDLYAAGSKMPLARLAMLAKSVKTHDHTTAQEIADGLLKESPDIFQFALIHAYLKHNQPSKESVQETLKPYTQHSPSADYTSLHHGKILQQTGKSDEAETYFKRATEVDQTSAVNFLALVDHYQQTKQPLKIPATIKTFKEASPQSVLALSIGDFIEGQEYTPNTEKLEANISSVLFGFSTIVAAKEAFALTHQLLQLAEYLNPENPFIPFYRGITHEHENNWDQAISAYKSTQESNPFFLAAQLRISDILSQQNKPSDALNVIEAIERQYSYAQVRRIKAGLLYELNRFNEAISIYTKFIEELNTPSKEDAWLFFARGSAYERLKNNAKAEEDLERSIALHPKNPHYMNYLGYMWVEQNKNMDKAFQLLANALLLKPDSGAIADSMGWYWYQIGDYEKAVALLERAVELSPEDATINRHLGDAYEKTGELTLAIALWQKALSLNPELIDEREHLENKLSQHAEKQ